MEPLKTRSPKRKDGDTQGVLGGPKLGLQTPAPPEDPTLGLQAQAQEWGGPAPTPPRQLEIEDSGGCPPRTLRPAPGQRARRSLCCMNE